jgi:hypothetical protein
MAWLVSSLINIIRFPKGLSLTRVSCFRGCLGFIAAKHPSEIQSRFFEYETRIDEGP